MNGKHKIAPAVVAGILIAAAIVGGLAILQQQGFLQSLSTLGPSGKLAAQITDPPNVPAGVTHAYIAYSDIKVHMEGGGSNAWYTVADAGSVDLMGVVNVAQTLGSNSVPTGTYDLVKFDILSATVTYEGVNYSAVVPSNVISVPIEHGGVNVSSGGNIGFVIDVFATVVPYQNGSATGFVLVPAARSIPYPQQDWHEGDDQDGARTDLSSQQWFSQNEDQLRGNITVTGAALTNNTLSLTVKNTGTNNVTLNSISVLGNITSLANVLNINASEIEQEGELQTIAGFQILSNGTVVQSGGELPDGSVGLVLQAGQQVTLTFTHLISTLHFEIGDNIVSSPLIISGQNYVLSVAGEYDARAHTGPITAGP
jgi:Domain of unknown function (DUF4382)